MNVQMSFSGPSSQNWGPGPHFLNFLHPLLKRSASVKPVSHARIPKLEIISNGSNKELSCEKDQHC